MKLMVVINDGMARSLYYESTGAMRAVNRRVVDIYLSPAQASRLAVRPVGTRNGEPVYETYESVGLVFEVDEEDDGIVTVCDA